MEEELVMSPAEFVRTCKIAAIYLEKMLERRRNSMWKVPEPEKVILRVLDRYLARELAEDITAEIMTEMELADEDYRLGGGADADVQK